MPCSKREISNPYAHLMGKNSAHTRYMWCLFQAAVSQILLDGLGNWRNPHIHEAELAELLLSLSQFFGSAFRQQQPFQFLISNNYITCARKEMLPITFKPTKLHKHPSDGAYEVTPGWVQ